MAVVTIGNFDGVHLGHRHLIQQVVSRARALGTQACAVTFDPHPRQVLRPDLPVTRLMSTEQRVRALLDAGLDDVWVCHFTREIAQLEAPQFLDLICARWPLDELCVGHDFALGRGRSGSLEVVREIGMQRGFTVHVVQPLRLGGEIVSSSRIRRLLEEERAGLAQALLGGAPQLVEASEVTHAASRHLVRAA